MGKIPWRRAGQPTPVLFPGKSHGQRSLADHSAWGRKEWDTTEWPTHAWPRSKGDLGSLTRDRAQSSCTGSQASALDLQGSPGAGLSARSISAGLSVEGNIMLPFMPEKFAKQENSPLAPHSYDAFLGFEPALSVNLLLLLWGHFCSCVLYFKTLRSVN